MPVAQNKKVVLFLYANEPNPGLLERMDALSASGDYEVHAVYWHRQRSPIVIPFSSKLSAERFIPISLPDPRGNPLRRVVLSIRFFLKLRRHLQRLKPDIVHAVNVDMLGFARLALFPGSRTRLVYDMQDVVGFRLPIHYRIIYRALLRRANAVLVRSDRFISEYLEPNHLVKQKTPVVFISNAPAGWNFIRGTRPQTKGLSIGYFGNLRGSRQLDILLEAVQLAAESGRAVRAVFAGVGPDAERIARISRDSPWIEYRGPYDYAVQRNNLYAEADVIYAVFPMETPNYRIHLARRFHEAILSGIPVIVADGSYMGEIVEKSGVGWAVDPNAPDDLNQLLIRIHDDRSAISACAKASESIRNRHRFENYIPDLLQTYDAVAKDQ